MSFSSVREAVTFFDAHETFPGVWLAKCPSCQRDRGLAISANPDQTVALGCQGVCKDDAVDLAVEGIWNRTRAITVTGTVTPSASPSGVGIGDPVLVSVAETATGTVLPTHPSDGSGGLVIDPAFRDLIRPLAIEERMLLEASIVTHGCRDAIVAWQGIIVDGHHRHEICQRLDIPFRVHILSLEEDTRVGALAWLIDNQLARRNLHPDEASLLRGHAYRITAGGPGPRSGSLGNFYPDSKDQRRTSERLAQKYGLSEKTIRNDAHYLGAVETIASRGIPRSSLVGTPDAPRKSAVALAILLASDDPDQQARGGVIVGLMRDGASLRDAFVKSTKATGRAGGPHETADAAVDAAVDLAGEADGKRTQATRTGQATSARPANDIVSVSVPDAVVVPPSDQEDADQDSGVSHEAPELVANSPGRDAPKPDTLRQSLFDTDDPPSMEVSTPIGRKAGTGAGPRPSADIIARTADPVIIASTLFEWLGSTKPTALVGLLQDLVRIDAKRVVPSPGQMAFA